MMHGPLRPHHARGEASSRSRHPEWPLGERRASSYTGILGHHFPLPYSLSRLLFSLYLNLSSEGVPLRYPVMRVAAVIPQLDMGAETLPTQNALERQRYGT